MRNLTVGIGFFLLMLPYVGWIFFSAILVFEGLLVLGNAKGLRLGDEMAHTQVIDQTAQDVVTE